MNNLFETQGIILEIIDSRTYKVRLDDESIIYATISGKMKLNLEFDIYVGEKVPVVLSPYDRTRGRINFRHWERTKLGK